MVKTTSEKISEHVDGLLEMGSLQMYSVKLSMSNDVSYV